MLIPLPELEQMPRPVRLGIILNFLGWGCFLFATYRFYDPNAFIKFTVAGGIVCYYLYKCKRWARVIAMLASVFVVVYCGVFTLNYITISQIPAMAFSAANVVLFAAGFFYLILPETNRYFKQMDPPAVKPDTQTSDSAGRDDHS